MKASYLLDTVEILQFCNKLVAGRRTQLAKSEQQLHCMATRVPITNCLQPHAHGDICWHFLKKRVEILLFYKPPWSKIQGLLHWNSLTNLVSYLFVTSGSGSCPGENRFQHRVCQDSPVAGRAMQRVD